MILYTVRRVAAPTRIGRIGVVGVSDVDVVVA
jgi:hypothetical protein